VGSLALSAGVSGVRCLLADEFSGSDLGDEVLGLQVPNGAVALLKMDVSVRTWRHSSGLATSTTLRPRESDSDAIPPLKLPSQDGRRWEPRSRWWPRRGVVAQERQLLNLLLAPGRQVGTLERSPGDEQIPRDPLGTINLVRVG